MRAAIVWQLEINFEEHDAVQWITISAALYYDIEESQLIKHSEPINEMSQNTQDNTQGTILSLPPD